MYTMSAKLTFHIPYADSLKEKRKVCRSIIDKTKHRFNVSVAEVDTQDVHRTLTLGIAIVSGNLGHARESLNKIINFMEEQIEAELIGVEEF